MGKSHGNSLTPQKIDLIYMQLSDGVPLREICRGEEMPCYHTVYDAMAKDEALAARIARARDLGFDAIAERARKTARGKDDAAGGDSTQDVQRDKLIVETDLKLLAKWSQRYSDKIAQQQLDRNGNPTDPLPAVINLTIEEKK